jgi:hypothetical protein
MSTCDAPCKAERYGMLPTLAWFNVGFLVCCAEDGTFHITLAKLEEVRVDTTQSMMVLAPFVALCPPCTLNSLPRPATTPSRTGSKCLMRMALWVINTYTRGSNPCLLPCVLYRGRPGPPPLRAMSWTLWPNRRSRSASCWSASNARWVDQRDLDMLGYSRVPLSGVTWMVLCWLGRG